MKRLLVRPTECTHCRNCELACAFYHSGAPTPIGPRVIEVRRVRTVPVPLTCLQCDEAACIKSCMFDALKRSETTGAVELNLERCVKCMACVAACPFGCALLDDVHNEVVKCDLCGGSPACAQFCPTKALVYERIA